MVGVGLATPLGLWIKGSIALRSARVAAGHIEWLLATTPLAEPRQPKEPDDFGIEFDSVSFSYDGTTNAVTNITVMCKPGTVTALAGPSGAGRPPSRRWCRGSTM